MRQHYFLANTNWLHRYVQPKNDDDERPRTMPPEKLPDMVARLLGRNLTVQEYMFATLMFRKGKGAGEIARMFGQRGQEADRP